jgi:hypothetical protein
MSDLGFLLAFVLLVCGAAMVIADNLSYRKVGGLHHWRIGRLGGSFYIARRIR